MKTDQYHEDQTSTLTFLTYNYPDAGCTNRRRRADVSCGREFRDTRNINSFLPAFTCTGSYNRNHKRACRFRIYVQSSLQAVNFCIIFFFKNILDQRKAYCGQKCKKGIILYYQQNKNKQPGIEKSKMKRPITVG